MHHFLINFMFIQFAEINILKGSYFTGFKTCLPPITKSGNPQGLISNKIRSIRPWIKERGGDV